MSSIKTPDTSHLTAKDFENVYEPAEDSFILLDALEIELNWIEELKPTFAIEIGPGSGIISSAIAGLSVNSESYRKLCFVFSCDINISACKATQRTAEQNYVSSNIAVICDNLLGGLSYRMKEKVDLVVCNPPYVITTDEELCNAKKQYTSNIGIEASWAGGKLGCDSVTNSLIQILPHILSPKGVCYIVLEKSNNPDKVADYAASYGFENSIVLERRAGREYLLVMKLVRK